jgi:hypothetical protein
MREYFKNDAATTIDDAGGIDGVVTSFDVASAAALPATPQFRILVDSEIMLVTGVSSNTLTVTRGIEGTSATTHDDGSAVTHMVSLGGLEQFHRDWNHPLFNDAGQTPHQLLNGTTTLTATDFTQVNFTNCTATDETVGPILLEHAAQGATNDVGMLVRSAPTAPWAQPITIGFICNSLNNNGSFIGMGPVIRDSSSGEFYFFQLRIEDPNAGAGRWGNRVMVQTYDNPTTTNTIVITTTNWSGGSGVVWMQIEDDNTNLIFRLSADGQNFIELGTQARAGFLTPDQVGVGINNFNSNSHPCQMTLVAWNEE